MPDYRHSPVPRAVRVAEEIQRILAELFSTRIQIPEAGLITVTNVELSTDLRNANIFISFLAQTGTPQEALAAIINRRKEVRFQLGQILRLKYVPELRFSYDSSYERSARINTILEDLGPLNNEDSN
ncbi:30S ribosome-binding factor RbfA [Candidatus Neomarinimicrobiota bacterium]